MQHLSSRAAASFLGSVVVPAVARHPKEEVIVYTCVYHTSNGGKMLLKALGSVEGPLKLLCNHHLSKDRA